MPGGDAKKRRIWFGSGWAEGEFVEIGLQVLAMQPVIDAQGPALEVGEDAVHPEQGDVAAILPMTWGYV